jgi:hypothetical protein
MGFNVEDIAIILGTAVVIIMLVVAILALIDANCSHSCGHCGSKQIETVSYRYDNMYYTELKCVKCGESRVV